MKLIPSIAQIATVAFLVFSSVAVASVQPPDSPTKGPVEASTGPEAQSELTQQDVEQLAAQLASAEDLSKEVIQSVTSKLKAATEAIARTKKLRTQAATDQKAISEATTKTELLRGKLSEKPQRLEELTDPSTSLTDLVAKLAALQPELQTAREKVRLWENEAARRSEQRSTITADLTSNPTNVAAVQEQLSASTPPELSPVEVDARQAMLKAQLQELNAQVPAFKAELSRYDAEKAGDFVNLQLQLAQRAEAQLQQQTERLSKLVADKRRADARYVADQLMAFATGTSASSPYQAGSDSLTTGPLKSLTDLKLALQTAEFAQTNVTVTADVAATSEEVTSSTEGLEKIRDRVAKMNEKIVRVGLTGAIGLELRKHLKALPDLRLLATEGRLRQKQMQEIDFERLELGDQLRETANQLATIRGTVDRQPTEIELRLLIDRHESLKMLSSSYSDQFDRLSDLDIKQKELIREVDEYKSFIREMVLWIRSHRAPGFADIAELNSSLLEVVNRDNWLTVVERIWEDMTSTVWVYAIFTLLVILLLSIQNRFRVNLTEIATIAKKPTCRTFRITIRALVLTTILAAAWPSLPAFLAWRLLQEDVSGSFSRAVGEGLKAFAAGFFTLNLLRHLCRPSGLGPVHFGWPAASAQKLRRETYRLMWLLLPLLFSKAMLHALNLSSAQVLERLVFIGGLIVMAWYQARVLHPNHGIFANWAHRTGGWIYQLRWVAFFSIIGLPLVLAAMAAAGYYYTAYELSWRLNVTIWLVITLLILRSFLLRLFLVQHRQLRLEQARTRRQAMIDNSEGLPDQIPTPLVEDVDPKQVSSQSRRLSDSILIIVGLLLTAVIWEDVHPALSVLDKWTVWNTTIEESVAYINAEDGASKVRVDQIRVPVTVADCLISLAVLILTITATRNLPGLLEITILQRLPIEPSVRYALRMVSQYFLVVIGTLMAFTNIGIGWDKVQWLAAALTVGLGFGLQEIFANFISGLIILFERPIRITDVVTIGDVTGSVSQIRMRATTITDWDLKEYIVPNKEFITGRLLNWTLSDKVNRVVIEVGVAYGTDTKLARKLLIEAASELDEVLTEPKPLATFEQFGDSTLNLRLRCYLPNLENRLPTITDLHEQIAAKFDAANIEISFPQLDLHVVDIPRT